MLGLFFRVALILLTWELKSSYIIHINKIIPVNNRAYSFIVLLLVCALSSKDVSDHVSPSNFIQCSSAQFNKSYSSIAARVSAMNSFFCLGSLFPCIFPSIMSSIFPASHDVSKLTCFSLFIISVCFSIWFRTSILVVWFVQRILSIMR